MPDTLFPPSSIWNAFQMESFLGHYRHPPGKPSLHTDSEDPTLRQRQQAFMTRWNRLRESNRYAPAMPSFFNPARSDAPQCAWIFLRDPARGGAVNEPLCARRGRESIFERPLVKLPLTRCRTICDRVRHDQQNFLGWGIHAWTGPSKHCRYCAHDGFFKGLLAYRAFELERLQEHARHRQELESPILMMSSSDLSPPSAGTDDALDPDAVLLSFPYRYPPVPTDPWINYNDFDPHSHSHSHQISLSPSATATAVHSEPNPNNINAWSKELQNRLLASPVIRDLDDFDLDVYENEDDGFYESDQGEEDDEDEDDGYSSSGTSSSDLGDTVDISVNVDVSKSKPKADGSKSGEKKCLNNVCGSVLMTLWQNPRQGGIECVEEIEAGKGEEELWVEDSRIIEVQA